MDRSLTLAASVRSWARARRRAAGQGWPRLLAITREYQWAESLSVRFWVWKSTWIRPEALLVPLLPLAVVHDRPVEIPADVRPVRDGPAQGEEVALRVVDPLRIVGTGRRGLTQSIPDMPFLGDHNRKSVPLVEEGGGPSTGASGATNQRTAVWGVPRGSSQNLWSPPTLGPPRPARRRRCSRP